MGAIVRLWDLDHPPPNSYDYVCCDMRLSAQQIDAIKKTVQSVAGHGARVWVFGSRVRDDAKGGDIDLIVETDERISLLQQACIKMTLEQLLMLPVDVITLQRGAPLTPFQQIAIQHGVPL